MSGTLIEKSTRVRLSDGREGIVITINPGAEEYEIKLCGGAEEVEKVPLEEIKEIIR
ncbi:MAG: hypothetical protein ACM3YE_08275 [Bacteroidota bacterium]